MLDSVLDIKHEIEIATGIAFPIENKMDELKKEFKNSDNTASNKYLDSLTRMIKKKEKKKNKHNQYVVTLLENGVEFNPDEEITFFEYQSRKKDDKKDEKEINVPVRIACGVSIALCGLLLYCLPPTRIWGKSLVGFGVALAIDGGIAEAEKEEDKKKK